ncbi:MAG: hypothetical protein B7X11_05555, partial [Acidobacteria bacterium 37-65-4]
PVQAPRAAGDPKGLAGSVQVVLDIVATTEGYRSAYLVTEAGTLLAASPGSLAFDDSCVSAAREVLAGREGNPEFHLQANESPLVSFAAAVAVEGVARHGAARPAIRGAVVLESDPNAWLYPMLAREPTHTATGETVLLGRQGTDIVFLTPPRRAGAWAAGRRVRTDPEMIAALEMPGRFHAGVDSRGVPVFAATSPVAGAPWSIVVKVAESEALGPYRRQLRTAALALSGFLLVLASASFGLWRERRFAYEKTVARSQARLSLVLEHANDAILFLSLDERILEANQRACELYGYTREEFMALGRHALHPPEIATQVSGWMWSAGSKEGLVSEHLHRRKDGSTFPVEASVCLVELGSER